MAIRQKCCSSVMTPVDRISGLPESLISYILSSLPTKDAVATSILSRSWRFRWTKITSFHFDNIGNDGEMSENQTRGDDAVDFVDSVNMVLLKHSGDSINKFLLRWKFPKSRSPCLNTWASIAVARSVRVLDLKTHHSTSMAQCELHLPSSLYTSGTLEILLLSGTFRVKPSNVVFLPKLVEMELVGAMYESDEAIHKLICGCPVLEALAIERLNRSDNLVVCSISSPSLKYLYIFFHGKSRSLEGVGGDMKLSIDAPALEELTILDYMSSHISIHQMLTSVKKVVFHAPHLAPSMNVGLMQTFSSVSRSLVLHSIGMMAIEGASLPVKFSFERLVKLIVLYPRWSSMMDLLDGCSILETLGIWRPMSGGDPWRNPTRVPRCLSSLKRITLKKFDGSKEEMAILKFFLDHCLVLERLKIFCDGKRPNDKAKRFEILSEVSKLSRASPACKIACL